MQFEGTVCQSGKGMVVKTWGSLSFCICSQEEERSTIWLNSVSPFTQFRDGFTHIQGRSIQLFSTIVEHPHIQVQRCGSWVIGNMSDNSQDVPSQRLANASPGLRCWAVKKALGCQDTENVNFSWAINSWVKVSSQILLLMLNLYLRTSNVEKSIWKKTAVGIIDRNPLEYNLLIFSRYSHTWEMGGMCWDVLLLFFFFFFEKESY